MAEYDIAPLEGHATVDAEAVVQLWITEGRVPEGEARRRVDEVLFVATAEDGALAAVCTVFLERNEQLRMDLWHFRTFVADAHRRSQLALALVLRTRDMLRDRFVSGEDVRGAGMVFEVESPNLRRGELLRARWRRTDFTFVGENANGAHVRVHYFPGALAPPPPA